MPFKQSTRRQRNSKNPYSEEEVNGNKHGTMAEGNTTARMGARPTPASGAMAHAKSDAILDGEGIKRFRIENKATVHESMSVKRAWLTKISREALESGRSPLLTVQFTDSNGLPKKDGKWVMMKESDFMDLIE